MRGLHVVLVAIALLAGPGMAQENQPQPAPGEEVASAFNAEGLLPEGAEAEEYDRLANAPESGDRVASAQALVSFFERTRGPDAKRTREARLTLVYELWDADQHGQALDLVRRTDERVTRLFGRNDVRTAITLVELGRVLVGRDDPTAIALLDRARPILISQLGETASALFDLDQNLARALLDSNPARAETILRRWVQIDESDGGLSGEALRGLVANLEAQGRLDAAAMLVTERVDRLDANDPDHRDWLEETLGALFTRSGFLSKNPTLGTPAFRTPERLRRLVDGIERRGIVVPETLNVYRALGLTLARGRRYAEATAVLRQAIAFFPLIEPLAQARRRGMLGGLGSQNFEAPVEELASVLAASGSFDEAEALLARYPDISPPVTLSAWRLARDARHREAVAELPCTDPEVFGENSGNAYIEPLNGEDSPGLSAVFDAEQAELLPDSECQTHKARLLVGWARAGGGAERRDQPDSLRGRAFRLIQAVESSDGDVISMAAARAAALRDGELAAAERYEALSAQLESLRAQFQRARVEGGDTSRIAREFAPIAAEAEEARSNIAGSYFRWRNPAPVSVLELQGTSADAPALQENEALVLVSVQPGSGRGLVFAVSRHGSAATEIPLTGDQVSEIVRELRGQIDPAGYSVRGFRPDASVDTPVAAASFPRRRAYDLYRALLGSPEIQALIGSPQIDTLIFVPTGPLAALPPSLLVTAEPTGRDEDPEAMRTTAWLIREKAVAVLPSVSSMRTLRRLVPDLRARGSTNTDIPFIAFANPEFGAAVGAGPRSPGPFDLLLRDLRPLPGTLEEARTLARIMGPASQLNLGADASESTVRLRRDDGALARARVLAFATHGLVSGEGGLTEPALALSFPRGSDFVRDDGMLTASEAAGLRLNAEWVILSACNTASPGADGGEALSGLARGFFSAGATSLLVSHWRVRDDMAVRLVTEAFRLRAADPALSKAQALRQAMLSVIDDSSAEARRGGLASPAAWAPFVLVGEPG